MAKNKIGDQQIRLTLSCKLGSIAVHADELISASGHDADRIALRSVLDDPEVKEWLATMQSQSLIPVKRR